MRWEELSECNLFENSFRQRELKIVLITETFEKRGQGGKVAFKNSVS